MRTQEIRKMIEDAVKDEERTGRAAEVVRNMANQNGLNPTAEDVAAVVGLIRGYIEHVPHYIEQGIAASEHVGLAAEMQRMVGELEAYWFASEDAIPDRFGLVGLLDDAYASLFLLQGISEYCRAFAGHSLLEQNLTPLNQAIRQLIGAPIAAQLEARVGVTIAQAMMQRMMTQFAAVGAFSFGGGSDPIWGNASIDEIVNARLGAMGFVR